MPRGRQIKVPEPITMMDIRNKKPIATNEGKEWTIDFAECVIEGFIMHDRRWSQNPLWMKARNEILVALDRISDGVMTLSEADYAMLVQVVNTPMGPNGPGMGSFHAAIAPQLLPHIDAILTAEEAIIP